MNKELFQEELKNIESEIEIIKSLDKVNVRLKQYNWVFLHPYVHGWDIDLLEKILDTSDNPEKEILGVFARKFLNLVSTIDYIEGFFKTRPFLNHYIQPIQESVVLCLQKDFRGAICVLIPVIEGTLRKYIIDKKGDHKKSEIDMTELLKAFNILTFEYLELQKKYLKQRNNSYINAGQYLDQNQEKHIIGKHKEYFELWLKQLKDYLQHHLYLNTKENTVTDNFNRHLIFHALEDDVEFTFGNYLRLFNCLHFLSWSIGNTTEGCSILSVANTKDIYRIWKEYFDVLIISEAMIQTKANIYGYPIENFKQYMDPEYAKRISKPINRIKAMIGLNELFGKWKLIN